MTTKLAIFVLGDYAFCFVSLGRWLAEPLLRLDRPPLADDRADLATNLAVDNGLMGDDGAGLVTKLAVDNGLRESGVGTAAWRIWRGCGWLGEFDVVTVAWRIWRGYGCLANLACAKMRRINGDDVVAAHASPSKGLSVANRCV